MDIVVVDDDIMVIALVKRVLKDTKYSYCCFSVPEEAIDYLSLNKPKILFVDYLMPKTDGCTVIEALCLEKSSVKPKLYLCSSVALPEKIHQFALTHSAVPLLKDQLVEKGYIESVCDEYLQRV